MGGTDDPFNLIELTVEEHADAHRQLFEEHRRWQDKLAWQLLSGMIGKEEAIREAQSKGDKSWMKTPEGQALMKEAYRRSREAGNRPEPWNKGLTKDEDIRLKAASERGKLHQQQGRISCIGDHHRGKKFTDTHKGNLSMSAKARSRIACEHCGNDVTPQMYTRWHGDNCKTRRG